MPINEMLAVLAHEMRTPISAILGYQELLSEGIYGKVDERGKEPLNRIAHSARQLLHLIDGVQEIAQPEEKRLRSQIEAFEPMTALRDCIANAEADATGRSVKLESHVPEDLPEMVGDPDRFCRAVDLALAAAVKTSHGATLGVHVDAIDNGLQVTIDRTGLALDRDLPDIRPGNGKLTGAGLRLAIVKEITRQMHGDLELTPTSAGTTVVLRFRSA